MTEEHPMERKKRKKKEAKEIRRREEANCDCPRKPNGTHDLEKVCYHGYFESPSPNEELSELPEWFYD